MALIQALLGGGSANTSPAASDGMDALQSLLGNANGSSSGSALDSLIDLAKGEQLDGQDIGNLIQAGMAFLNAKNQGQDTVQAAISALVSGGPLGGQPHRKQSGEVVAGALFASPFSLGEITAFLPPALYIPKVWLTSGTFFWLNSFDTHPS